MNGLANLLLQFSCGARFFTFGYLFTCLLATSAVADILGGRVLDDLDRNGRADPDDPGVANVRVSNGRDVTPTGDSGTHELGVNGDSMVFITKPSGYMTPLDVYRLPRFYYLHRPIGSPAGLRCPGIEPTGPLPERIDFALHRLGERANFEAVLFADPQPQTEEELDYIRDGVTSELVGVKAAFRMSMGDILFGDLSMFPRHNSIVAMLGTPWYNIAGNRELNLLAPSDVYSLETFSTGTAHPIVPSNTPTRCSWFSTTCATRVQCPHPTIHHRGGYEAALGEAQLERLKAELEHVPNDRLLVLAMHLALLTRADPRGVEDRQALFDLLTDYPNLYAMAGHTHTAQHPALLDRGRGRLQGRAGVASPCAYHGVGQLVERPLRRGGAARLRAAARGAQGVPPPARRRHRYVRVLQGCRASRQLPDAHHAGGLPSWAPGRLSRIPTGPTLRRPHQRGPGRCSLHRRQRFRRRPPGRRSGSRSKAVSGRKRAGYSQWTPVTSTGQSGTPP